MIDFTKKDFYNIDDLLKLAALLRSPEGCPWDREQTHKSVRRDFIEETYEVIEAIDNDDSDLLCEELGDVLWQVVFHCEMEREAGRFTFSEIVNDITAKLVHRHPNVFGDLEVSSADDMINVWNANKAKDKKQNIAGTLEAVSKALPALIRAQKIAKRSEAAGERFGESEIRAKIAELAVGLAAGAKGEVNGGAKGEVNADTDNEKLGELLFFTAFLAEKSKKDAEKLLTDATIAYIETIK